MTEGIPEAQGKSEKPFLEEAAELGAEIQSQKSGKPVVQILDEAEKHAEREENTFFWNLYKKIKNKIRGS